MVLAASCLAAAEDPTAESASFRRTTGEIVIDGRLDDASWQSAIPRTKFYEIYPADTGQPPVATDTRFLYDERNIYVAIRALDPRPSAIRAPIVRRDQVLSDQDYVEVFLDPLNTRRSASFFRVSARGIVTDGQYDDENRLRDYSPDLDFQAATIIDEDGWTAEIRIPLSSLRYQAGVENPWAYVIYRNLPRQQVVSIASAPIPRGANCDLCYANLLEGIPVEQSGSWSVSPHIAYARLDDDAGASDELEAGIDVTWKPRENTVVDATIFPDFSQIEADAPQLTANTQFALALTEKRPFFLEGTDLLTTQIPAIYTRAFTDPDAGVRITDRSSRHEYTALALRDAGGGTVIEPGPINSRSALQDFASTAFVGRESFLLEKGSVGMLATGRFNDDGSQNVVIGADATWTPSAADQITAQVPELADEKSASAGSAGCVDGAEVGRRCGVAGLDAQQQRLVRKRQIRLVFARFSSMERLRDAGRSVVRSRLWLGSATSTPTAVDSSPASVHRSHVCGYKTRRRTDQPVDRSGLCRSRRGRHATYRSRGTHTPKLSTLAGLRSYDSWVLWHLFDTVFAWMPQAKLSVVDR